MEHTTQFHPENDDYQAFLATKALDVPTQGKPLVYPLHPVLKPHQRDIAAWVVERGRAAIFAAVGLGKTLMQLEAARQWDVPTLILAPLGVTRQTIREADHHMGLKVRYITHTDQMDDTTQIYISNYERVETLDPTRFQAVILDESSILKRFSGTTKKKLVKMFADTPFRLCCTATPAPNEVNELGNHAEFLGIRSARLVTAEFFISDSDLGEYRLKRHAVKPFYRWLATWAVALEKPSDLGYPDDGYDLPAVNFQHLTVQAGYTPEGMLPGIGVGKISATEAGRVRKQTIAARAAITAKMVNDSQEQWLIWCGLNDEAYALEKLIPDSVNVEGKNSAEDKAQRIIDFTEVKFRVLITKDSIYGLGVNLQHCRNMVFFGMNYSWEDFYQARGRVLRFGQKADQVNLYVITSEEERGIWDIVQQKGIEAEAMKRELIAASSEYMKGNLQHMTHQHFEYHEDVTHHPRYDWYLGDSCAVMPTLPDNSVDISIYSPPFGSTIFIYSPTPRDVGNARSNEEFMTHYAFIVKELLRITKPGRVSGVHIQDTKLYGVRDGVRGISPLSDQIIKLHLDAGWIFRSRITIDKDPQLVATRNKDSDLLFVTGKRDSTDLAPMNTDYLLVFKKPGDNEVPVTPYSSGEMTEENWIKWARAVWYGIRETNVLNVDVARGNDDERHLCPLQLDLITRFLKLYSNRGETVFTPFGGIASEVYVALANARRGIGIELNPNYWRVGQRNLENALQIGGRTLWDFANEQSAKDE